MTFKEPKIAITGHTAGLGKGLYEHFVEQRFEIKGFSRSNGYDLTDPMTLRKLAEELESYDILINNAHADWSQTELLYLCFEKWKSQPKHIINVSSNSGDGIKPFVHPYAIHKAALDKACEQLNAQKGARCRVTNLRPGWINTERIAQFNVTDPKISIKDITLLIEWLLRLPQTLHISTISMTAREP